MTGPPPESRGARSIALAELGTRIQVTGHSCAGKSTLGGELASALGVPCIELDALNWLPGWVGLNATDPERFRRRIREATAGDAWVLAGSYESFVEPLCWPRMHTLIFLDLPRWRLVARVLRRSWRRWRTRELLWGTNREKFWPQLAVWNQESSLLWWVWTQHARKRARFEQIERDPKYAHLRLVRLGRVSEIEALRARLRLDPPRVR
jgi:adenylate kinase family enzyme